LALKEKELEGDYLKWLNNPEVNVRMSTGLIPNSIYFAIVEKKNNKHIGSIKLDKIDWISRRCELGILIRDKNFWESL
jgi:RimJ/RimL family protein N-acetyltransferase